MSLISTVFVLKLKFLIVLGTVKKKNRTIKRINSFIYLFVFVIDGQLFSFPKYMD